MGNFMARALRRGRGSKYMDLSGPWRREWRSFPHEEDNFKPAISLFPKISVVDIRQAITAGRETQSR
jgi:hypothetical protein